MRLTTHKTRRIVHSVAATALVGALLLTAGCAGALRQAAESGRAGQAAPAAPQAVNPMATEDAEYSANYTAPGNDSADDSRDRHPTDVAVSDAALSKELAAGSADGVEAVPANADQLIVRTKSMLVRVKDVEAAVKSLRSIAAKRGGFVEALQLADDEGTPIYREGSVDGRPLGGYVTLRIPVSSFERFVADAAKLGRVLRQAESSTDVTQQHVDLKARLENLRAEEARLRDMFDAAKKVSEMLEVERELSRVRGEAESLQAQIDSLERQAALSTITIELQGPEPIVEPSGVDWGVADAFRQGVRAFVASLNAMIVLVMGSALWVVALAAVVLAVWAIVRSRRRRRGAAGDSSAAPE